MINLKSLDESEMRIYMSAYEFYCSKLDKKSENLEQAIEKALNKTMVIFGEEVNDTGRLKEYLQQEISMIREQQPATFITNEEVRNSVWWDEFSTQEETRTEYWDRYAKYLKEDKRWDRSAIEKSIDITTNKVMNAIANPRLKNSIERKGMVVGYVQSGKTAHYIGLINKAVDSGYKIIIVLAGMHNNLRAQTQSRIDEEVLGFETSLEYLLKQMEYKTNIIGVGEKFKTNLSIQTLTTRDDNGDFNNERSKVFIDPDNTTIFIVKKNYKVLGYLMKYFRKNPKHRFDKERNRKYMDANYPLLLIDDEADQASVNTNYEYSDGVLQNEDDPSKINEQIRDLFHMFDCRSYVGYTATPYANIFIPNQVDTTVHGKDLFPTHFILSLPKPSNYIGAHEFFGDENNVAMPLRRKIDNKALCFIDAKNKVVNDLPEDLQKAIKSFLLSTAIRICRGQSCEPNSMLIHVARLTDIQKQVYIKISKYFDILGCKIIDGHIETIDYLQNLWQNDYEKTTNQMRITHSRFMNDIDNVTWEEVFNEIKNLISNDLIKIYSINGKSKDCLLYKEHKGKQYNVIAIGGDKLARGLTLEGLTVSYFTRETKMYDTLMQMGRWFGFRPGYVDLCRLYVQDDLFAWFKHISLATDDLREQIDYMNNIEETPENFGLRVATHPDMKISNPKKVQTGEERKLTFSNVFSQTRSMDIDADKYDKNFEATNRLLLLLGEPVENYWKSIERKDNTSKHYFWKNVNGHIIADFLMEYKTSQNANKANSKYMAEYIEDQMKYGGLINWTVCLINTGGKPHIDIANLKIGSGVERENISIVNEELCSIQTLTSGDFQYYDFTKEEYDKIEVLKAKKENKGEKATSDYIREQIRSAEKGLLIICPIDVNRKSGSKLLDKLRKHKNPLGIAVVFPHNKGKGKLISYRMNEIGLKGESDEIFE